MNLVLFDDALQHLTRIHQVIRMDQGHALLVVVVDRVWLVWQHMLLVVEYLRSL